MTLNEFKAANRSSQIDAICDKGVRLSSREYLEYNVILYQIDSFYIEVFYDKQEGSFSIIRAFSTTLLLDPYLESINIDGLLQD